MAPRGNRKKKKKQQKNKKIYRGFPVGFQIPEDSTVNIQAASSGFVSGGSSSGAVNKTPGTISDSDDEPPEIRPSYPGSKRMSGELVKKLDELNMPNISTMSRWTSEEYAAYDEYLMEKWKLCGYDKKDDLYVSLRDFHSKVSHRARTVFKRRIVVRGKVLGRIPLGFVPDFSSMFGWKGEDYDHFDQYLIKKWNVDGYDMQDDSYVSIRDKSSAVYKAAQGLKNKAAQGQGMKNKAAAQGMKKGKK